MTISLHRVVRGGLAAALMAVAPAAWAADLHVRGTVATHDGDMLAIKTREGTLVTLTLGPDWKIVGMTKASVDDIKPGTFIGTANTVDAAGAKALEVVVFPEAMRGSGEGDYGWDLKPNSSMTNATVSNPVEGVDGRTVTLSYKGGQKKVTIPPGTPIVTPTAGTAADLTPGAAVFVAGAPGDKPDTLAKGFIAVGRDGIVPPM